MASKRSRKTTRRKTTRKKTTRKKTTRRKARKVTRKAKKKPAKRRKKAIKSKIADLEKKLQDLSKAEAKPAEVTPPPPQPAEVTPPPPPPQPRAEAPQVLVYEQWKSVPAKNWNDQKAVLTGWTEPSDRYFASLHVRDVPGVPTANWNDQKEVLTGYTQPGNRYFATRQRMAYHPRDKTFLHQEQALVDLQNKQHLHLHNLNNHNQKVNLNPVLGRNQNSRN